MPIAERDMSRVVHLTDHGEGRLGFFGDELDALAVGRVAGEEQLIVVASGELQGTRGNGLLDDCRMFTDHLGLDMGTEFGARAQPWKVGFQTV